MVELLGHGNAGFGLVTGVIATLGAANAAPVLGGLRIDKNDSSLSYFGGVRGPVSPTSSYDTIFNVTYFDGTRGGLGGRVAFQ